jgi:serine phosphatase RsbU (regulator of sigma subunit)
VTGGSGSTSAGVRLASLRTVASLLAPLRTPAEVAEILVGQGAVAIGGGGGSLCMLDESGKWFELLHQVGYPADATVGWKRFPTDAPIPSTDALRTGHLVALTSIEDRNTRYPSLVTVATWNKAFAVIPLLNRDGATIGVLNIGWADEQSFSEEDVEFLETLGLLAAQAIERARLFEQLTAGAERLRYLAEASRELSSSLDLDVILRRIVELAVPSIADSAALHLWDGDDLRLVALRHATAQGEAAMRALSTMAGDVAVDPMMLATALTGEAFLMPRIPDSTWRQLAAGDEALLERYRALDNHSGLLVPLRIGERILGILSLTTSNASGRVFVDDDLVFARAVAVRAAIAIENARAHEARIRMADTLQRSLLPPALATVPGLEVAAFYRPMGEGVVGGDFYDLFALQEPDGAWGLVVGDVSGKGVEAAALTALVRYTTRAVASMEPDPARLIARCNFAVLGADPGEAFATMIYGVLRRRGNSFSLELAVGGHPLPVMQCSDGAIREIGSPGRAVGLFPEDGWTTATVDLDPGDTLVVFTDGLIEARSPDGVFAPDLLWTTLRDQVHANADAACNAIVSAVQRLEDGAARDDMAIVVLRVTP